jgi:hypothetical protein
MVKYPSPDLGIMILGEKALVKHEVDEAMGQADMPVMTGASYVKPSVYTSAPATLTPIRVPMAE